MNLYELLRPKSCNRCGIPLRYALLAIFTTTINAPDPIPCPNESEHDWS